MFGKKIKRERRVEGEIKLDRQPDVQLYFESGDKVSSWLLDVEAGCVKKVDFEDLKKASISFSDQDQYILAKDKQLFRNINSYILQEYGKKMFYIDQIKKLDSLYATPESRLNEIKSNSVFPGVMALRVLLENHKKSGWMPPIGRQFVTGFLLPIQSSTDNILILYAANEDLNLAHMQIIPNVDKWQFNIDNYARSNKMFVQGEKLPEDQIILFDAMELVGAFGQMSPYPIERQYFGVKESRIFRTAATIGVASAVLAGGYATFSYNEVSIVNQSIETTKSDIEAAKKKLINIGVSNFNNIVKAGSIDVDQVLDRARSLGLQFSTQKISTTRQESTHRVVVLMKSEAEKELTLKAIKEKAPPPGCKYAGAFTNPSIQFLELKYVCKNNNANLSSLYGDPGSPRD